MRKSLSLVGATKVSLVIALITSSSASAANDAPLPDDLNISCTEAELTEVQAFFCGEWVGSWSGGPIATRLVVEHIHPDGSADIIYANGNQARFNVSAAYQRATATIEEDRLSANLKGRATATYERSGDELHASYARPPNIRNHGTLTRVK